MIGNCDCCDRENVPVVNVNTDGEPVACFICQGDSDPDPYGEVVTDWEDVENHVEAQRVNVRPL